MMMVIEVPPQKSELELNFTNDYTHPRVVRLHKEAANTKKKKKEEKCQNPITVSQKSDRHKQVCIPRNFRWIHHKIMTNMLKNYVHMTNFIQRANLTPVQV